ncbi:MAG TPA: hypothetical protein VN845_05855, partial [Solirubrobacteraceae bacterium]|nr:hypothetical protein [Solirubrobacteraceae bacterium]
CACLALAVSADATKRAGRAVSLTDTASATPPASLKVAFRPEHPGSGTTIEIALHIGGTGDSAPEPVTALELRMPEGMGLASSTLGQSNCLSASLIATGPTGCSGNALIGLGKASAVVPVGSQLVHETATVDALLGAPGENRIEILFYVRAQQPVFGALVLPSVLEEDAAPFGESLDTSIPLVQTWPEGPDLALQTFSSSLGPQGLTYHRRVAGKTISYRPLGMKVPRTCPAGGYPFGAKLAFADGTHSTVVYRVPCPAAGAAK